MCGSRGADRLGVATAMLAAHAAPPAQGYIAAVPLKFPIELREVHCGQIFGTGPGCPGTVTRGRGDRGAMGHSGPSTTPDLRQAHVRCPDMRGTGRSAEPATIVTLKG